MSLLWFCTFILGVSLFTPISSFSLSIDYFEQAFPGGQMAVKVTVCYEMAFVAFQLLCHLADGKLPLSRAARIELRHLAVAGLMAFIIVWERVINGPTGHPPEHSSAILLAAVTVTGMFDGICVGAVFGEAAILGPGLAHALVAGTAGVMPLLASLRIIFKAALPPTPEGLRLSISLYFAAAVTGMLAGFVAYCMVVLPAVTDVAYGAENSKYIDDLTTLPLVPTLQSHARESKDQMPPKHGSGIPPTALRSMSSLIRTVTPEEASMTMRSEKSGSSGREKGPVRRTLTPNRGSLRETVPEEDCIMRSTIPSGSEYCPPLVPEYRQPVVPECEPSDVPDYQPPAVPEYRPPVVPEYRPPVVPEYLPPVVPEYRPPLIPEYRPPFVFGKKGGGLGRAVTAPEHDLVQAASGHSAAAGGLGPGSRGGGISRTSTLDIAGLPGLLRTVSRDVAATTTAALSQASATEIGWSLPSSMRGSTLLVRRVHSRLPPNDLRVGSVAGAAAGSMLYKQPSGSVLFKQPSGGSMLFKQPTGGLFKQPSGGSTLFKQPSGSMLWKQPSGGGTLFKQPSLGWGDWGKDVASRANSPLDRTSTHGNNPFKRTSLPVYPSRFHRRSLDIEAAAVHDKDAYNWPPTAAVAAAAAAAAAAAGPALPVKGASPVTALDWSAHRDQLPHQALASISSGSVLSSNVGDRFDSMRSTFSITDKQLKTAIEKGETDELLDGMITQAQAHIPLEPKYFGEGVSVWRGNWLTIKDNLWYVLAIILTYTCNYGLFPAVFAYMAPSPALGSWYSLLLVTVYGIGDLAGKLLPVWKPRRPQIAAMILSVVRLVLFFTVFALALLFKAGPGFYFPAVFLLSLTAWYEALIFSLACEGHHPDDAYQVESLLAIQLDVGIGLGSVISLAWSAGPWALTAAGAAVAHG